MIGLHNKHPCKLQIGLPSLQDNHKWVEVPLNGVDPQTGPNVNRDNFFVNDILRSVIIADIEKRIRFALFLSIRNCNYSLYKCISSVCW